MYVVVEEAAVKDDLFSRVWLLITGEDAKIFDVVNLLRENRQLKK